MPSIPPYRDIDFCIDIEIYSSPSSITPYYMAIVELRELKDQIQEFLDKWVIDTKSDNFINKESIIEYSCVKVIEQFSK